MCTHPFPLILTHALIHASQHPQAALKALQEQYRNKDGGQGDLNLAPAPAPTSAAQVADEPRVHTPDRTTPPRALGELRTPSGKQVCGCVDVRVWCVWRVCAHRR